MHKTPFKCHNNPITTKGSYCPNIERRFCTMDNKDKKPADRTEFGDELNPDKEKKSK